MMGGNQKKAHYRRCWHCKRDTLVGYREILEVVYDVLDEYKEVDGYVPLQLDLKLKELHRLAQGGT